MGNPNIGIISLSRIFTTSVFCSVLVGYASTHSEKVSTKINRCLKVPVVLGIGVMPIFEEDYSFVLCPLFGWLAFPLDIISTT